jgi:AcrR family transcriptional regulator
MAQRPKQQVHAKIVKVALQTFADNGYQRATLADIAEKAGTSVGNLYKYFANKDVLFAAAMPPAIADELEVLLRRRVKALGVERDTGVLSESHPYRLASDELLGFAIRHRCQVLFLLRSAEGTTYGSFVAHTVRNLVRLATGYAKRAYPRFKMTAVKRRALVRDDPCAS